jgi:hypothetical protein
MMTKAEPKLRPVFAKTITSKSLTQPPARKRNNLGNHHPHRLGSIRSLIRYGFCFRGEKGEAQSESSDHDGNNVVCSEICNVNKGGSDNNDGVDEPCGSCAYFCSGSCDQLCNAFFAQFCTVSWEYSGNGFYDQTEHGRSMPPMETPKRLETLPKKWLL